MSIKFENTEVMGWEAAIRGCRNPMNSWKKSDSKVCEFPEKVSPCWQKCNHKGNGFCIGPNDHDLMMRLAKAGSEHAKYRRMITVYADITAPLYWWKEFKTYRAGRKFGDGEPDLFGIPSDYLEQDIEMNSCSTMHKIHTKEFTMDDFSCEHMYQETYDLFRLTVDHLNKVRDIYLHGGVLRVGEAPAWFEPKDKEIWWQMIQLLPSSYNQKRSVCLNYEVLTNIYRQRKGHKLDEWETFRKWIESLPYSEIITLKEE